MSGGEKTLLIIGATSSIALAYARLRVAGGPVRLILSGRNPDRLALVAKDLGTRGAVSVACYPGDIGSPDAVPALLTDILSLEGSIDEIFIACGTMTPNGAGLLEIAHMLQVNLVAMALWAEGGARALERQGHGHIVIIGSVAGDRGRTSNSLYGASKAGLERVAEGLSLRFHRNTELWCTLVKPGLVDTPMTQAMSKDGSLWSTPDDVARSIVEAVRSQRPVAYVPGRWRCIMLVVRHLPRTVLSRLGL
ncbi:SDR family NAD(P)-dependent oxidoreductase [Breoghania sp. L-A4]|uniref:SDR family NAD(P)-dependent oxidoreductase n=1 Tax=Breoghania sp. L-A4 TaxID=2304600 RepID=UPI000E360BA1|nr:SDR family NAD(P)-dependent oxidoreductase [Breoghania sp. L-A4]AXS42016.1 SDR family NAD(P)-dependent oxidoreductase [Breoghania sp. L-A4]